jgi:hypothetical protein
MIIGFINHALRDKIASFVCGEHFPWFYSENTIYDDNQLETYGALNHIYFKNKISNSLYIEIAYDLLHEITSKETIYYKSIYRMQSSMLQNINVNQSMLDNAVHRDHIDDNYITILYYVIDSDGPTLLYKNGNVIEQSDPIGGKYIIYSSNTYHMASIPKQHKTRIIFNYILEI